MACLPAVGVGALPLARPVCDTRRMYDARRHVLLPVLACLAPLGACQREPPPPTTTVEPVAVFVSPVAVELRAGEAVQLVAQASDDRGRAIGGASIDFESEAPALADVTLHGLVAATGSVGTTTVRVASGTREMLVPVTVRAGPPRALAFIDAPPSESAASADLPLTLRVADAFGNPVPRLRLALAATAGGGTVDPADGTTDGDGILRATWRLGPAAGEHLLEARLERVATATVRTTVVPPPAEAPAPEPQEETAPAPPR
jgi:hypothetical protein